MATDDDKRMAFEREKATFEQNCAQLRTLVQELHKKPLMAATLTGGLWAALSIFKPDPAGAPAVISGIFSLIAIVNAFIAIAVLRLRDVMESYIEQATKFSADFGAKGGRPTRPFLPWVGGFSIALTYVFMTGTIVITAWLAPFFFLGWTIASCLPTVVTLAGVGGWFWFTTRRRAHHELDLTLKYYNDHWREYVEETKDTDLSDITNRFGRHLSPGATILDVGAGSGRDSKQFLDAGFNVVALEPSAKLANHLRKIDSLDVINNPVEAVEDVSTYDGIWACASLLHLDAIRILEAMRRLTLALKPGGYFYVSIKDGKGTRIAADGRTFHDMSADELAQLVRDAGLSVVEFWRSPNKGPGRNQADWHNIIARKPL